MGEAELERRLLRGDPQALSEIIDLYGSLVYRLAARILAGSGDSRDVEECCSDTFQEVFLKREQFDPARAGLRTWVLMLTRYRALDYRRRLERRWRSPAGEVSLTETSGASLSTTPETVILDREERRRIADALSAISPSDREIIYRRYYLDESIEAIASAVGISRGAADSRLWRARRSLRRLLLNEHDIKVVSLHGKE